MVGAQRCYPTFGMDRGEPFPVSNPLCFLPSKNGLKGCIHGQSAGEVCGSLGALVEGRGQPGLPLTLTLWGQGHSRPELQSLCLVHTPEPWPSPDFIPAQSPLGQVTPLLSPPRPSVQLSVGPIARDVESLALCLRALLCEDMFRLDPTVPPLPFQEEVSEGMGV